MRLIVAEKPSVARDIARVLGCKKQQNGALVGADYAVVWAVGHIIGQCDPGEINPAWQGSWRLEALPMLPEDIPLKVMDRTRDVFDVIARWMSNDAIESIICATDAGREGELIFRWIYQMAKCQKPIQRLWISSLTEAAITEGFSALQAGADFQGLFRCAACRAQADWLVGMNASRAYSTALKQTLSVGRVQTPTLAFLVERQKQIDAFVPVEYATVTADFGAQDATLYQGFYFTKEAADGRIFDLEQAKAVAARARKQGQGVIASVEEKQERTPPPLLFDLTALQREANRRLKMTAQATLSVAQALYEKHKAITYPRTDSRFLTKDLAPTLPSRLKAVAKLSHYQALAEPLLGATLAVTNRIVQDAKVHDHHAIIPTERSLPAGATPDERALYDLIARSFMAAFYPAELASQTTVVTAVGEDQFLTRGRVVQQEGWRAVWKAAPDEKKDEKNDGALPPLKKGEEYNILKVESKKKKTTPPKPYTDATLLSAMETAGRSLEDDMLRERMKDSGLGTPATRAAIIERLITVGYALRKGNTLGPTPKGNQLIAHMPEHLTLAETTAKWELALHKIAAGEMEPERFMQSIQRFCVYLVQDATAKRAQPGVFVARWDGEQKTGAKKAPVKRASAKNT